MHASLTVGVPRQLTKSVRQRKSWLLHSSTKKTSCLSGSKNPTILNYSTLGSPRYWQWTTLPKLKKNPNSVQKVTSHRAVEAQPPSTTSLAQIESKIQSYWTFPGSLSSAGRPRLGILRIVRSLWEVSGPFEVLNSSIGCRTSRVRTVQRETEAVAFFCLRIFPSGLHQCRYPLKTIFSRPMNLCTVASPTTDNLSSPATTRTKCGQNAILVQSQSSSPQRNYACGWTASIVSASVGPKG